MIAQKIGVLLAALSSTMAFAQTSAWEAEFMDSRQGVFAVTLSDAGNILGRYCYYSDATCFWVLANSISCTPGNTYSILASSRGSAHLELPSSKVVF